MKKLILFLMIINILLASNNIANDKQRLLKKQVEKNMAQEKKFAQEQMFYKQHNYDFKGSEVNPESLK
jgi:ABC-type microcin C transport system permease subunit YejE